MKEAAEIIISGITGFVGSHLARKFLVEGCRVSGIVRPESDLHRIESYLSDLFLVDIDGLDSVLNKNSVIVHCATEYGRDQPDLKNIVDTNIQLPIRIMERAIKASAKMFINTDSFFTRESNSPDYMGAYIISKTQSKDWLKLLARKSGFDLRNVTLEHVYGPGDNKDKFIPWLIRSMKSEDFIDLTAGDHLRDFVFIEDVASAYVRIVSAPVESKGFCNYDVGSGIITSVRDFISTASEVFNEVAGFPAPELRFGAISTRPNEIEATHPDLSRLLKTGWKSKYNIRQGLRETIKEIVNE